MTETILEIEGMMCSMCEAHINDAIRKAFAVKSVKSSRRKGRTVIRSASAPDRAALEAVIRQTGYRLCGVTVSEK